MSEQESNRREFIKVAGGGVLGGAVIAGLPLAAGLGYALKRFSELRKNRNSWMDQANELARKVNKGTVAIANREKVPIYFVNPDMGYWTADFAKERKVAKSIKFDQFGKVDPDDLLDNVVFISHASSLSGVSTKELWEKSNSSIFSPDDFGWSGQGLMISEEGHMAVSTHVLYDRESAIFRNWNDQLIIAPDKKTYQVTDVLVLSFQYDLALVKTNYRPPNFTPNIFTTAKNLKKGKNYVAVGRRIKNNNPGIGGYNKRSVEWEVTGNPATYDRYGLVSPSTKKFGIVDPQHLQMVEYNSVASFVQEEHTLFVDQNGILRGGKGLEFRVHSRGGFSGGVIRDRDGKIAGFISRSNGVDSTYATSTDVLKEMLAIYANRL